MTRKLRRGEFAKYDALGNDYFVIDPATFGVRLTPSRIRAMCERNTGPGSDGIVVFRRSRRADFAVRIFNPDGSEAEKSGNGLRILGRALYDMGYTKRREFTVETKGGDVGITLHLRAGRVMDVSAEMGRASVSDAEVLSVAGREIEITRVSIGNPHCVVFVNALDPAELRTLGPALETHESFPDRTNVQLAHVVSRERIDLLIWERGAGATLASGSSGSAVAAAAHTRGRVGTSVALHSPGGVLRVRLHPDGQVTLRGPATPIYRGVLL